MRTDRDLLHALFARITRTLTQDKPVEPELRNKLMDALTGSCSSPLIKVWNLDHL